MAALSILRIGSPTGLERRLRGTSSSAPRPSSSGRPACSGWPPSTPPRHPAAPPSCSSSTAAWRAPVSAVWSSRWLHLHRRARTLCYVGAERLGTRRATQFTLPSEKLAAVDQAQRRGLAADNVFLSGRLRRGGHPDRRSDFRG